MKFFLHNPASSSRACRALFTATLLASGFCTTEAFAEPESCYESGKSGSCAEPPVEAAEPEAEPADAEVLDVDVWGSLGWFWVSEKAMPSFGLFLGAPLLGDLFGLQLSVAPIWTTDDDRASDEVFLGAKFGIFAMVRPYSNEQVDLRVGIGADLYYLGGINKNVGEAAFAMTADVTGWVTPSIGLFVGVRGYPFATTGLELGTDRNGDGGFPLLFETGIRFR